MNYDASPIPERYAAARALPAKTMAHWLDVVADAVASAGGGGKPDRVLDLGCGTGRFTAGLQGRLSADVIGIDPSSRMLLQAPRSPRVRYVRAVAEALPLRDRCIDLVFMSMVWHHFRSRAGAAGEIRRVLKTGGLACVRTCTLDVLDTYLYPRFFPTARRVDEARLPSRAALRAWAVDNGFDFVNERAVVQELNASPADYVNRVALRGFSDLLAVPDAEFERGLGELRRHCERAESADPTRPVTESVDFFVFRR